MVSTSTYRAWAKAYDGDLAGDITRWRADGTSVERIAQRLREGGVTITTRTLYRWLSTEIEAAS